MIYPERESKSLEFKSQLPHFKEIIKTCVAFANGVGGELVVGVEDGTCEVLGIDDATRERLYEDFPNALYDSTQPSLVPQIYERSVGDLSVIIIKIAPVNKKPCFVRSSGIPNGVYCRVGPHTRKATDSHIDELMKEARHLYHDNEGINAMDDILDKSLLREFYSGQKISSKRLLNDKIVVHSPGNEEALIPTIAGALFFSHHPQDYIPEAHIICTRFAGTEGREIIQSSEITGSLLEQANDSLRFVRNWLKKDYKLSGAQLSEKTVIPEEALREAINNALLHRKYTIPGAIKIAIYDNRIEIFSPGQFPGLVDINNLGDGTTFLRNPTLVRLARHIGLIEKLGSGIRLIFSSCAKAGIVKPTYSENGDFVKVTFHFEAAINKEDSQNELILNLFKFKSEISINDITTQLNISRNTATRHLNHLIEKKLIIRTGKGPAVRYLLS